MPELDRAEKLWTSSSERSRREEARRRVAVYNGEAIAEGLVARMPDESPAAYQSRCKIAPPLLWHVIDALSFLYNQPPERTSSDGMDEEWDERLWSFGPGLDPVLQYALELVKLCGQAVLVPRYQDPAEDPLLGRTTQPGARDGISWRVYHPGECLAVTDPLDADSLDALAVVVGEHELEGGAKADLLSWWDREVWGLVAAPRHGGRWRPVPSASRGGELREWHPHGLGLVPAWPARKRVFGARAGWWALPPHGDDLLPSIGAVLSHASQYLWTAGLQRGQWVVTGTSRVPQAALSPVTILHFEEPGASAACIGNAANLAGMREALDTSLAFIAKCLGIPSRAIRLEDIQAQSGVAIAMDRSELSDERTNDAVVWRATELALHRLAALVLDTERQGRGLAPVRLDPASVWIDYPPLENPPSAAEVESRVRLELEHHLVDRVAALLTLHPGLDPDVAAGMVQAADADMSGALDPGAGGVEE